MCHPQHPVDLPTEFTQLNRNAKTYRTDNNLNSTQRALNNQIVL